MPALDGNPYRVWVIRSKVLTGGRRRNRNRLQPVLAFEDQKQQTTIAAETPRPQRSSLDLAALGTMTAAVIDMLLGILTHTDRPTGTASAGLPEGRAATGPPP